MHVTLDVVADVAASAKHLDDARQAIVAHGLDPKAPIS
jgi:hypothetical protein